MKLREGITFHDGTPLNADAVIVNFETARQDPLVGLAVKPFYPEEGAIEKVDDLTVIFNLLDAHANFPTYVTGQLGMVASPTWLEAALADPTLNQEPVGTGPFVFASRSEDSVTRFERNENWWNGDVYLDAIEFLPVTDSDNRIDLLLNGEIDGLQTTNQGSILDLRDADGIRNLLDDASEEIVRDDQHRCAAVRRHPSPRGTRAGDPDPAVRRPDRSRRHPSGEPARTSRRARTTTRTCSRWATTSGGRSSSSPSTAPSGAPRTIRSRAPRRAPTARSTSSCSGQARRRCRPRIADLLDQGWGEAFNVTFDELLQDEHILQTALGQYNVNTWRQFGAEDPAADNVWLLCRTIGGISLNWPRNCDEERDALLLQAQALDTVEERAPIYQQVEQMIHDAVHRTCTSTTHSGTSRSRTSVKGVCDRTSPEGVALRCASNGRTWFSSTFIG